MKKLICSAALLCFVIAAHATTTYTQTVSSGVSSLSIAASTSGMTGASYGVQAVNSGGVVLNVKNGDLSWSIDQFTYNASITFAASFTGTVTLQGLFTPTSAATDFQLTLGSGGWQLRVCAACSASSPAARNYNNNGWAMTSTSLFTAPSGGYVRGTNVSAYLTASGVVWVVPASTSGATCSGGSCSIATTAPAGGIALGYGTAGYSAFSQVTDQRPTAFQ